MRFFLKVIGFCGLPGSGKSTALQSVDDLGVVINMGDVVRDEALKKNIELTNENLSQLAKNLRTEGGDDIIAKQCIDLIHQVQSEVVFVDGLRSPFELRVFRKYWKFPLIVIEADENNRYQRIIERQRNDDSRSIRDIKRREEREIEFGLKELIQVADYIIKNNSSIHELKKNTRKLIKKLINNYASI